MKKNRFLDYLAMIVLTFISGEPLLEAKEYTGIVTPVATSTYGSITLAPTSDVYGNYSYIARPGEIITPQVSDLNGKVLKSGTLLLQMDMRYWNAVLDQYKANLLQAEKILNLSDIERLRHKKLYETKSASLDDYQNAKIAYHNALITKTIAEVTYRQQKFVVDCYTNLAPFEGIVTSNTSVIGAINPFSPAAVSVAQLNPIGIKVKMKRDSAKAIGNNTPIKIFPINSNNPQGIFYGSSLLTDDGIEFITENYPVVEGTMLIKDESSFVARNWGSVKKFYIGKNPEVLAIPLNSLVKNEDKYFVWKAKGQKNLLPDKPLDRYFQIEKICITPADLLCPVDIFEKKIALTNKGNLQLDDLVMINPTDNLIDGQTVLYPEGNYLLMPGDQVKVIVGSQEK